VLDGRGLQWHTAAILSAEEDKTVAAETRPGQDAPEHASGAGADAAPEDAAAAPEQPERKLRVAQRESDAAPEPGPRPELLGDARPTFFRRPQRPGLRPGVTTVNRGLTAVIVLMLLFAMIEIWANIQPIEASNSIAADTPVWTPPGPAQDPVLPPIENVLDSFSRRPIFSRLEGGTEEVAAQRVRIPNWEAYTRENVNLIGTSAVMADGAPTQLEAVLVDAKTGRMHFLQVGQSLRVEQQELRLTRIGDDKVVVSDGTRDVEIK
jgi:hypothetical protein